jgi:hypothetical protein
VATNLPAHWVDAGYGIPAVCSRHGRPATRRVAARFVSRPSPWAYPLIVISLLVYAIVAWATRKAVVAKGWPFCARCGVVRVLRFLTGSAVFAVGVAAILLMQPPMASDSDLSLTGGLILVTGLILFLAGIIIMAGSGWAAVARATVTRDGAWVTVRRPHPEFDAHLGAVTGTPLPAAR